MCKLSVTFLFSTGLLLVLAGYASEGALINNEERNIFFNKEHYDDARTNAREQFRQMAEKTCPNHKQEIKKKIETLQKCAEKIDEDTSTMCMVIQKVLQQCFTPLTNFFEGCVAASAKGVPTYVQKTVENLVRHLCDIPGKQLIELGNQCILKKEHGESKRCIKKLNRDLLTYYDDGKIPEKAVLCAFFEDFRPCYVNHVNRFCHDNITREAYEGAYDVFRCSPK